MAERTIIVMEDGKKVYEGPEQRHSHNVAVVQPNRFFGLAPETWIKIGGFLIAIVLFYARTDDFMKTQAELNKFMIKYVQNSDAYHSASTGFEFEQGRPTGRSYGAPQLRGRVSTLPGISTPAHAADNAENVEN